MRLVARVGNAKSGPISMDTLFVQGDKTTREYLGAHSAAKAHSNQIWLKKD